MKRPAILLAATAILAATVVAQDRSILEKKRDAKMAEKWIALNPWVPDHDKALAASARTGKPVFAYFTRSYAP